MKSTWSFCLLAFFALFATCLFARGDYITLDEEYSITGNLLIVNANIDVGEVEITKSDDPNKCFVYIRYLPDRIKSDIRFNEKNNELEIIVDCENWKNWKDDEDHNNGPEIRIQLPSNPVIDLNADFKAGEYELQLGDLKLQNFNFHNWAGEATIDFNTPNLIKMNELDINFKVGELTVKNLGNARFEEADINSGIGELNVDFSGEPLEKAMARLDLDIGETTIVVPNTIGTKMRVSKFLFLSNVSYPHWFEKKGSYYYSENYDESSKFLYLMISTGIGELSIRVE